MGAVDNMQCFYQIGNLSGLPKLGGEKARIVDCASLRGNAMTESVRKRKSKWDLKAETDLPTEIRQDNALPGKEDESVYNYESKSGWNSPKIAGSQDPKWSNLDANSALKAKGNSSWSCWEPMPGKSSAEQEESMNRGTNEIPETMMAWGGDQSYSSSMSPGLDAWRQQSRSHSPKSGWSRSHRSRSRSPPHGFKRESEGRSDRSRSGSGISAPTCNDFAAGRCRRGSQCRFLHPENRDYEGRRHSERGRAENRGGRHEDSRHSESGLADSRGSRHERGEFSRHANNEEPRDYSSEKISHGYGNQFDVDREKHEPPRNNRSINRCNDFLKGKCYRGSSCKYAHHGASADGHGGWSTKEVARERSHDRRETSASFEHNQGREPRRCSDMPCKFFASGNCRNGRYCRFSHGGPGRHSPEGRSRDDRWGRNLDTEHHMWGGPKWSDTTTVADGARSPQWRSDNDDGKNGVPLPRTTERSTDDQWGRNSENENRTWRGRTWNDMEADQDEHKSLQWSENNGASVAVPELSGSGKPLDSTDIPSAAANRERYPYQIDRGELGRAPQDSQSRTPNEITLPTSEHNITQGVSCQQQHSAAGMVQLMVSENAYIQQHPSLRGGAAAAAFPCEDSNTITNNARSHNDMNSANSHMVSVPGQSLNQHSQSVGAQPSSFNVSGRSQQILPPHPPSGQTFNLSGGQLQTVVSESPSNSQSQTLFYMEESNKPEKVDATISQVTSGAPLTHSVVNSEQVSQITNLSASLAQIFGNGQQLPQLYAALNPSNAIGLVPSHPNSTGTVAPVTVPSNEPNQTTWSQMPYDPIGDSIESSKPDTRNQPQDFSSNSVEQKNAVAEESQMPLKSFASSSLTGGPSTDNPCKNGGSGETLQHESHESKQLEPVADCEVMEKNDMKADQRKMDQENGHSEEMDVDGRDDEEGKRSKDGKGMRMFKFALVEFVKEILKPTWKEGQMSKEAHKTIVKKVVDKVTGAIQGVHIPQTQEKIDYYLSYSKPKLTKLVQAYVEKYLKS